MSKSIVYKISWKDYQKNPEILEKALDNFKDLIKGKTAVKIHFGEPGNDNAFRGKDIVDSINWIKKNKINAFLTDTNTLYVGLRSNTKDHLETAKKHGFEKLGLPIVISEDDKKTTKLSELKNQYKDLPIKLGQQLRDADSLIVINHVKGHVMFGYGGALKNLGMGGATPAGKRILHNNVSPIINQEKCIQCQSCIRNCPAQAISIKNGKVTIDHNKCIGCGECLTVCPQGAVEADTQDVDTCQEKTAVYAYGLAKNKPMININYVFNINPVCDCARETKPKLMDDVGIMISTDPVAVDQASLDWINKIAGKDLLKEVNKVDYTKILKMGEKIGLGSRKYEIKKV